MAYTPINKSTDYFDTKLYVGNSNAGSPNAQTITGVGFKPDWSWIKNRDAGSNHALFNSVGGVTKFVSSNDMSVEETVADTLTAFNSNGFTLGTDVTQGVVNNINQNFASWNWKAGTTSGISAGSQNITPSAYSINTTAGFGIYKWSRTGASTTDYFSHGLGATPKIAIQKRLDAAQDWYVNTTVIDGTNDNLHLNKTDAKEDDSTTVPTSTNYYPKSPETGDYITYLFTPKVGFSAMGSYTGNGNADGPFIHTGFKPAWILIKRYNAGGSWRLVDNKRIGYNRNNYYLTPNTTGGEGTGSTLAIDMFSNGFKVIGTDIDLNTSGGQYIYMAFAEAPLVGSNNVPATAR